MNHTVRVLSQFCFIVQCNTLLCVFRVFCRVLCWELFTKTTPLKEQPYLVVRKLPVSICDARTQLSARSRCRVSDFTPLLF